MKAAPVEARRKAVEALDGKQPVLVRQAAAWVLGEIGEAEDAAALERVLGRADETAAVLAEARRARELLRRRGGER